MEDSRATPAESCGRGAEGWGRHARRWARQHATPDPASFRPERCGIKPGSASAPRREGRWRPTPPKESRHARVVVDLDVVEAWSLDGVQAGGGCREGLAGTSPEPVLVQRQHRHVAAEPPTAVRWSRADAPMGMDGPSRLSLADDRRRTSAPNGRGRDRRSGPAACPCACSTTTHVGLGSSTRCPPTRLDRSTTCACAAAGWRR
jgi:hypothetical protein